MNTQSIHNLPSNKAEVQNHEDKMPSDEVLRLGHMRQAIDLPLELILMIRDELQDHFRALNAMTRTSKHLRAIFEPFMYRRDALRLQVANGQDDGPSAPAALLYGASHNFTNVMEKSINAALGAGLAINIDLLGAHPRVPSSDYPGRGSAMHFAAYNGCDEAIRYLLSQGARLDLPAERLCNCLTTAMPNHVNLRYHNWRDADYAGWWPLHFALCQGHSRTMELLIDSYAPGIVHETRPTLSAVHSAARADHREWVYELIQRKVNEDGPEAWGGGPNNNVPCVNWMGPHGLPLHYAVVSTDSPGEGAYAMKTLVGLGADLNRQTPGRAGRRLISPIAFAIRAGYWQAALTLLRCGTSVASGHERSLIFSAVWSAHQPILGDYGVPEPLDYEANLPLRAAVIRELVVRGKINLDKCFGPFGETPLTFAGIKAGNATSIFATIPMLLALGAGINSPDANGITLLHSLAKCVETLVTWRSEDLLPETLVQTIENVLRNGGGLSLYMPNSESKTPVDLVYNGALMKFQVLDGPVDVSRARAGQDLAFDAPSDQDASGGKGGTSFLE
ncbi:Ankyrin repeat-containing domain protein [Rhypophila decipiens]